MSEKTTIESGQHLVIAGLPDARGALLELLRDSRRQLLCYSPLVDARLYDDAQVVETLRQKLVRQPRWRLALLLPPVRQWRRACPRLNALLERLSSAIELRHLDEQESRDRPEFGHALFIGDDGERLLRLLDPARHVGEYLRSGSHQARDLQGFFQECWSKALPDSELRRLGI